MTAAPLVASKAAYWVVARVDQWDLRLAVQRAAAWAARWAVWTVDHLAVLMVDARADLRASQKAALMVAVRAASSVGSWDDSSEFRTVGLWVVAKAARLVVAKAAATVVH